ncbi:MAG: acyclic terpene utilization AtuA family protein, partial [Bdellovibrionota bacterium]
VTGRCVDSALVLAPAIHRFGWKWNDYDRLSQASLAGHVIECGTQCTGGNFTDWESVPGRENVGFPIVRLEDGGDFLVTKPSGTGGLVSVATVAEQVLYEIGDPANFLLPDVICDWTNIRIEASGPDRVRISGAKGRAPTATYKVSATELAGFRISTTASVSGGPAREKARSIGEAILKRCSHALHERGIGPYSETRIEALGGGDQFLLRISAAHDDAKALELLAKEIAPAATSLAPGVTSLLGGRAQPSPRVRFGSFLIAKSEVSVTAEVGSQSKPVSVASDTIGAPTVSSSSAPAITKRGETVTVALGKIVYARSGDKGNDVNIGVIARDPKWLSVIRERLGISTLIRVFEEDFDSRTNREVLLWDVPGLNAVNFLLKDCLGGGGSYSLRIDPQGKAFAQRLLATPIEIPKDLAP